MLLAQCWKIPDPEDIGVVSESASVNINVLMIISLIYIY